MIAKRAWGSCLIASGIIVGGSTGLAVDNPQFMDSPHRHPHARYVTVLEGTWYAGTGDTFDLARAVPLKPGSFMLHPAKAPQWDGSAGDQPLHALTRLAFALHIGGGAVGLVSGTVAVIARKGGRLHRKAGTVFVVSMLVMAVFACYLGLVIPDQRVNVFISVFALYLILTAWLAIKRRDGAIGLSEKVALLVGACLCAPFAILSCQLAMGLTPLFKSAVPFKGSVLIAIYGFTSVLAVAAMGDARVVLAGGISGVSRISRHLWRMCLGLTLAAGSGFTNGFARLLPGPYHVPLAFFLPQFIPLGLLVFWMVRVRQPNSAAIVLTACRASAGSGAVESSPTP